MAGLPRRKSRQCDCNIRSDTRKDDRVPSGCRQRVAERLLLPQAGVAADGSGPHRLQRGQWTDDTALALALALWVYTTGLEDPVQTQLTSSVPVIPRGLRAEVTLQNTQGAVTVKAVGLRSQLEKKVNIIAYVDLKDVTKNTGEVVATVELEGGNSNLQYAVTPPSVTLVFEPTVSRTVPVSFNPAALLSLPASLTAPSPPQLIPVTAQVSGPKNLVDRVKSAVISASLSAVTAPSISVASFPVSFAVSPTLVDKLGVTITSTLLQVKPSTVKVILQVNQPQITKTLTILPIQPPKAEAGAAPAQPVDYIFEPDPEQILGGLLPRYVDTQVYQAVVESIASEHGARMTAMDSATKNAKEMIGDLTLQYNRARQAAITKELMEIIGGAEALKE